MDKLKNIDAVIVSVNYADFLKHTLPNNKVIFDNVIVVTHESDIDTKNVCNENNVRYLEINETKNIKDISSLINLGLNKLKPSGFVVNLDADIWMPICTKDVLRKINIDSKCIYGIDRLMIESFIDFDSYVKKENGVNNFLPINLDEFKIGRRLIMNNEYYPIGFFQMWNPKESGIKSYSVDRVFCDHNKINYDGADVLHARKFNAVNRKFLPEFCCLHLASEHNQGQNWKGRKSKQFN